MKKWNRILKILLLTAVVVSVSVHTIIAYLADEDTIVNSLVVGGNHISVDEDYDPKPITPGASIKKKVRIYNNGPNTCYIRVRAVFSDSNVGKYASIDWNTSEWIYNSEDEFYYYRFPVSESQFTSYLMTTIKVDNNIPEYYAKNVELIVYAESYQSEGFSDYRAAWNDYRKNIK